MKNAEKLFAHLWNYGDDDQDYWMPYEVGQESAAAAHVEFWRSLHPSHDGEVLHAKLSEA
jgi:hypothetical protein